MLIKSVRILCLSKAGAVDVQASIEPVACHDASKVDQCQCCANHETPGASVFLGFGWRQVFAYLLPSTQGSGMLSHGQTLHFQEPLEESPLKEAPQFHQGRHCNPSICEAMHWQAHHTYCGPRKAQLQCLCGQSIVRCNWTGILRWGVAHTHLPALPPASWPAHQHSQGSQSPSQAASKVTCQLLLVLILDSCTHPVRCNTVRLLAGEGQKTHKNDHTDHLQGCLQKAVREYPAQTSTRCIAELI